MAERKIFAGRAVRRLRRARGLTQAALAGALDISPSYLNLIERDQRPLSATVLLRLADRFDMDPRLLRAGDPGGGVAALRRRLSDPAFRDLNIDLEEVEDWVAAAPGTVEAFVRLFERGSAGPVPGADTVADPVRALTHEIERWRNHYADLDVMAETIAEELRLSSGDLYGALGERLRNQHKLTVRVLPAPVLGDRISRFDLHSRQLQLSEWLDAPQRTFHAAMLLGEIEARVTIDALVEGAGFADRTAQRLYRRYLAGYFAAAVMMPYQRFLQACEAGRYDLAMLERRFGASFEQVAHRLTTLHKIGARGLPFFMLRVDRAGQLSKRLIGASHLSLPRGNIRCPLWKIHAAGEEGERTSAQLVELENGERCLSFYRAVRPARAGGAAEEWGDVLFTIVLGVDADIAASAFGARVGETLARRATPIGPSCPECLRQHCPQRSLPPDSRVLSVRERDRGPSPYEFESD